MYLKPKGVLNLKYAALLQLMRLKMDANEVKIKEFDHFVCIVSMSISVCICLDFT